MGKTTAVQLGALAVALVFSGTLFAADFNYQQDLFGAPTTLGVQITGVEPASGLVSVNGADMGPLDAPFTWNWGDGIITEGYFPQSHTYANRSRNYIIEVTAHYVGGGTARVEAIVFFVAPALTPVSIPPELEVTIPDHDFALGTHLYPPPTGLSHFEDSAFPVVPRSTMEYVMGLAAVLQMDYANNDVFLFADAFRQVVLRDPAGGGMCSLWFTNPASFSAGDYAFGANQGEYSSFFHEMGHNVSLNSPAAFYYGGKIDGPANAIFSETMAQVFQHATAYDLVNNGAGLGLAPDLATAIGLSAHASMRFLRNAYTGYVNGGMHYASWDDPGTPGDEALSTFATTAYVFCSIAEQRGAGYREPLKKMMELLQVFNASLQERYDPNHDTPAADAFRATLMIAAMSHGFGADLRQQFRDLNFPVDDAAYEELMAMVRTQKDPDADGLTDAAEEILGTSPTNPDTDGDGVNDGVEVLFGFDPLDPASTPSIPAVSLVGLAVLAAVTLLMALKEMALS